MTPYTTVLNDTVAEYERRLREATARWEVLQSATWLERSRKSNLLASLVNYPLNLAIVYFFGGGIFNLALAVAWGGGIGLAIVGYRRWRVRLRMFALSQLVQDS